MWKLPILIVFYAKQGMQRVPFESNGKKIACHGMLHQNQ
jgi:hypothetical protein